MGELIAGSVALFPLSIDGVRQLICFPEADRMANGSGEMAIR